MPTAHSYYPYLLVYDGGLGEKPHPAAFYVCKKGDTLSNIAKRAYGLFSTVLTGVQNINRNPWNQDAADANAFKYRKSSMSCSSKVVDPAKANTTVGYNEGGWLALCPPYPLFWIPATPGQIPEDLKPPAVKLPAIRKTPHLTRKAPAGVQRSAPKQRQSTSAKPSPSSPYYQQAGGGGSRSVPGTALAGIGIPWWGWLLLAAAAVGGYVWYRKKK